jgi:cyclopropane-fatty-acyl-phospholipid synthase
VSGGIDVDDMDAALQVIAQWQPPALDNKTKARIGLAAVKAGALRRVPKVPEMELRPKGARHSILRDKRAVTHHYNLSNEYFSLFLDESMTYSCGIFSRGATTLEEAQRTKLELVCTKLALQPGERVLDVGCGWGAFAIHAATRHGVHVTGITLSEPQAQLARERAAAAGVADKVDIRVMDYREIAGETFDAIASIGMVEHVGSVNIDVYMAKLAALLKPGGRLLNHGIARLRVGDAEAGPFSERYVFPDAAPLHLSRIQLAIERAGLHARHVEDFPDDYARTLLEWQKRFEANIDRARQLGGDERVRVWRIYLRVSRQGFESGFISVYQVRAVKPG